MSLTTRELAILRTPLGSNYRDRLDALIARLRGLDIQGRGPVSNGRCIVAGTVMPDSLVSQYDARELILNDGDTVFTWNDGIGSNNLSNSNDYPKYSASEINGNPAVEFNGSSEYISGSSRTISTPFTVIAVLRWTTSNITNNDTFFSTTNSSDDGFGMGDGTDKNFLRFGERLLGNQAEKNVNMIMTGIVNGTNSVIRRDGSEEISGDAGTDSIKGITIGRAENLDGNNWAGPIGILEIHNKELSGSELIDREQTIADEWGITI